MKHLALPTSFLILLGVTLAVSPLRDDHPSETSRVLATYTPAIEARTPDAMAAAATAFLKSLDEKLAGEARFPLDHPERRDWTNVPPGADEGGARLGDLSEEQLRRACDLLATVLSPEGYAKSRDILLADDRLLKNGQPRRGFGAENFWLALFGDPAPDATWALQLDGHHLALNLTFDGDRVGMSPSFIGTQPSSYERGGETIVPLRGEVEAAFALVGSLTEEQRERALVQPRRGRIATAAGRDGVIPDPVGVPCKTFDEKQRELAQALVRHYVGDLPRPQADRRMKALAAEIDEMVFAWSGPTDHPSDVSYRLQGPTLIIEYACQDLGGDPLDHLHSMYRDPTSEYGAGR